MKKETNNINISRRKFLAASGGISFLVTASALLPGFVSLKEEDELENKADNKLSAWVHLSTDGKITILNPSAEMGQGSMTALAVLIAEELDAEWSDVIIKDSPTDANVYGLSWGGQIGGPGARMLTVGSRTVRGYYNGLRKAGAQARRVLLDNVAQKWSVPVSELTTEPSVVVHAKSGRRINYGDIAQFAQMPEQAPEIGEKDLKSPEQFRLIGTQMNRFDIPEKTNGKAKYSIDVLLPNMAYGMITRSPAHGAKPTLLNEADIREKEGLIDIVVLDHGIGIITEKVGQALKIKKELKIEWSKGSTSDSHNSVSAYDDYATIASGDYAAKRVITSEGSIDKAAQKAAKSYEIDYKNDYAYHAQMEPLNAVVSVAEDGKSAEAWVGSQSPPSAKTAVARVLDLSEDQITLHTHYLGGGFGRRSMSDYVEEAAHLAKMVKGRPLKLIWTREDDVQYGAFRPMSLQRMRASVDNKGMITGWEHYIVGTGGGLLGSGAEIPFYAIPNQQIEVRAVEHGIRTKHWRSVGHGPNKFAIEAFIDEIAHDLKKDPYEYRRQLMKDSPRAQKVLAVAAEMANWGGDVPEGRARGIAFAERSGSLSAGVVEISVDPKSGEIKVHHIWASLDAGVVVQPDNAIAQMEGAILFGLSSVLKESITFKKGQVQESNFHNYPILRMTEIPETLEVKLIPSTEPPAGIGEAGLPVVGGAIANAFLALTGKTIRHMPFTPSKVKAVLG
jgi:isoquinoline 1-oxidoreductase beta subunit